MMNKKQPFRVFLIVIMLALLCGIATFVAIDSYQNCGYPSIPDINFEYPQNPISVSKFNDISLLANVQSEMRMMDTAFSPDGKRLTVSGQKGEYEDDSSGGTIYPCGVLFVWSLQPNHLALDFSFAEAHIGPIREILFAPSGRYLYAESSVNTSRLWDVETYSEILTLGTKRYGEVSQDAAFDLTGVAFAYSDGGLVQVWETLDQNNNTVSEFPDSHHAFVDFIDSDMIAVALDHELLIWNYRENTEPVSLVDISDQSGVRLWAVDFDADLNYLAVGLANTVYILDLTTNETVVELPWEGFLGIQFHPNHNFLIAESIRRITIGNVEHWTPVIDIEVPALTSFALSTSGELIAIGYEDGSVEVRGLETGDILTILRNGTGAIHALDFNFNDTLLVVISNEGSSIDFWGITPP